MQNVGLTIAPTLLRGPANALTNWLTMQVVFTRKIEVVLICSYTTLYIPSISYSHLGLTNIIIGKLKVGGR